MTTIEKLHNASLFFLVLGFIFFACITVLSKKKKQINKL